jgi:hypothetical protein
MIISHTSMARNSFFTTFFSMTLALISCGAPPQSQSAKEDTSPSDLEVSENNESDENGFENENGDRAGNRDEAGDGNGNEHSDGDRNRDNDEEQGTEEDLGEDPDDPSNDETSGDETSEDESDAGMQNNLSCFDRGCTSYDPTATCQCDSTCEDYGDCCDDYMTLCVSGDVDGGIPSGDGGLEIAGDDAGSDNADGGNVDEELCADRGCFDYAYGASCQCDSLCVFQGDCCADYEAFCSVQDNSDAGNIIDPGSGEDEEASDGDADVESLDAGLVTPVMDSGMASVSIDAGAISEMSTPGEEAEDAGLSEVDSEQTSCEERGCYAFDPTQSCQCDGYCKYEGDCCDDYILLCDSDLIHADLVINEVDVKQANLDDREFVEIYNASDETVMLADLELIFINQANDSTYRIVDLSLSVTKDSGGNDVAQTEIVPGEFLVAGGPAILGDLPGEILRVSLDATASSNLIQNGDEAVVLQANDNGIVTVIDALSYGDTATDPGEGAVAPEAPLEGTLCRIPDGIDTGNNSVDFLFLCEPATPGAPNRMMGLGDDVNSDTDFEPGDNTAGNDSICAERGCGSYNSLDDCQCDSFCQDYADCCTDYEEICVE